jgi:predicted Zn-dependent peptidase
MTAYLFSGTANISAGINLLLDFVQDPFFTDESVKKEQGIIIQELKMYLDDPNDALHLGLMQNLFQQYPLRYDVGGTVDSIMKITKEHLYKCYRTFYHPSNMDLIIVGDPDSIFANQNNSVESVFNLVRTNQAGKKFPLAMDIKKNFHVEDGKAYRSTGFSKMDIMMPKAAVGLKLPYEQYGENAALTTELKLRVLIEAVLGPTSDAFQEMLDLELINGNLYYDVFIDGFCGYVKLQANTHKPRQFIAYVKEKLLALNKIEIEEELFERFKKSVLGSFLKSLNNPDYVGFSYLECLYKQSDLFATIEAFTSLRREELLPVRKYFVPEALSDYTILPKKFAANY